MKTVMAASVKIALCLAFTLLSASLAFAQGDPIINTVTGVKSDNIAIKDKADKTVIIMVLKDVPKDTKDVKDKQGKNDKQGAALSDLKAYTAEAVAIGAAAKKPSVRFPTDDGFKASHTNVNLEPSQRIDNDSSFRKNWRKGLVFGLVVVALNGLSRTMGGIKCIE